MPRSLSQVIQDPQDLLALDPEELGYILLKYIAEESPANQNYLNRVAFCAELALEGYDQGHRQQISEALAEAWSWLEQAGLISPKPDDPTTLRYFIPRLGKTLRAESDFAEFKNARLLPKALLHHIILEKCWSSFLRGDYDTAVFQAFKEVEIAVRKKGGFADTDFGPDLMRRAFNKDNGPLTDPNLAPAEKEGTPQFFAGAYLLYRNPVAHHNVGNDAREAASLLVLASHLLFIVDSRGAA